MTGENWSYIRRMQSGIRLKKVNSQNIDSYKTLMEQYSDILSKSSRNTDVEIFGIESEEGAAGIIVLSPSEEIVELLWILVDEDKRHQGYGSKLLIKAKEYARELGCGFVGGAFADNLTVADVNRIEAFFLQNGFYRSDRMSKGHPSVLCDLDAEIEDVLEDEDDDTLDIAGELEPLATITVQKLQRLKEMLQESGNTCDLVFGEGKAFLWVQDDPFDLQISLLTKDSKFEVFFYTLSAFVGSEEGEEELKETVLRINSSGSFITAITSEGGIVLNYTLFECGFPIDERSFLTTYAQFREEVMRIYSMYAL
jgi:GNAT superfamily N-acetyltransferase